ncbi:MAG: ROK family protein [Verrucomicrobiales bacterium]|nr:ROK family protein [Verrucomicrobiales bacterium]
MSSSLHYLGIDIGGTKTAVSIMNETAGVVAKTRFPSQGKDGAEVGIRRTIEAGQELIKGRKINGIGISVGAMFDLKTGCFGVAPHLPNWENYPLVETIENAFSLPVTADNDANACALAEWRYGAAKNKQHLAFLTFGTGLGAGFILNNQIFHGASNLAGEIGALCLEPDGPPVRGKPGCLEGFASGAGIAGLVEKRLPEFSGKTCLKIGANAKDVATGARAGDALCLSIMQESGNQLGRGLAILMNLLNLEMIVIGSIFTRCENLLRPAMQAALYKEAMPSARADCTIVPAALGEEIGDYAALALAVGATEN